MALMEGSLADEKRVHQQFAKHRINGEWFSPAQPILRFVAKYPPPAKALRARPMSWWSRQTKKKVAEIKRAWFNKNIRTDSEAAAKVGLNRQMIKGNLGPSGRKNWLGISGRAAVMQRASAESKIEGRMPVNKARKIWFHPKMKVKEKLDLMTGWSRFAAYDKFGKTQDSEGRRK